MRPGIAVCALAVLLPTAIAHAEVDPKIVGCHFIKTAAQLQAINKNATALAGTYCLANDIDASSVANFTPIGNASAFSGQFYGNGHVIRNLTISNTVNAGGVGLFAAVLDGVVQDVGLVNANVSSTVGGFVGALIGSLAAPNKVGRVQNVYSTGKVTCTTAGSCVNGGLVGTLAAAELLDSWSSASVVGDFAAGGLVGAVSNSTVRNSYATGDVTCNASACGVAGGLTAGGGSGLIVGSYASGTVTCLAASCLLGGLVGELPTGVTVINAYATGSVRGGNGALAGSLIGSQANSSITASYGAGPVSGGSGAMLGGLIGAVSGSPTVTNSYWDMDKTGQSASAGGLGTGKNTLELSGSLLPGFATGAWGISKTLSYPFLNSEGSFSSTLAGLLAPNKTFTFLPIQQSDNSQYIRNPSHTDQASLAAVYTMIARAVGHTDNVASLKSIKIDKSYWHDATQKTTFAGAITTYATLGPPQTIPPAAHLNSTNVLGLMAHHYPVILRGTYLKSGGGTATHYMLGTLYTKVGNIVRVIANDPWTGTQIEIDPATKHVLTPGFPLSKFTVDGCQGVALN